MAAITEYSASTSKRTSSSNTQLLEELEELTKTLYQPTTSYSNRRTASLALPRNSVPAIPAPDEPIRATALPDDKSGTKPRSRRMSLSPWRSRPKLEEETEQTPARVSGPKILEDIAGSGVEEKKGIWNWKPIRALAHIGKEKVSCLFSVEVVAAQGLPASMNGLRLSVCVRKKENKDGAVQTMPSRVSQGAADFEETLFVKCHVYTGSGSKNKSKFEPRPFLIYLFAVDADELNFGTFTVDLSRLIQESVEKNNEGMRIRQWDTQFNLSGKAKGGELVLKLGFQIMEKDGGVGIYSQGDGVKIDRAKTMTPSFGRKQSKTSFSIQSPRLQGRSEETWTPSQGRGIAEIQGMDDLNLDEPAPVPSSSSSVLESKTEQPKIEEPKTEELELEDLPDFEVVDKGVEVEKEEEVEEDEAVSEEKSASSEVVKEMVTDQVHQTRLTELDSIAEQIKALESMMAEEEEVAKAEEETESQGLDADEETVTMEFLQMLEEEEKNFNFNQPEIPEFQLEGEDEDDSADADGKVYVPDLGKGLRCIVQTRNGGYLAAMNPLDIEVSRKEMPKLAMQISKPLVLQSANSGTGFELFQRMAAIGVEELSSQFLSLMPMDELMGKTAEQIAFEGIASAIIHGRNKEGASSSAARTVAAVKNVASALTAGRKDRISTGIWNVSEKALTVDEILAFSIQKIEAMAVEALKIQADLADEAAPFDVSPLNAKDQKHPLDSAVPLEDWVKSNSSDSTITISVVVQLRDPLRRYEVVGGPVIVLIHATSADNKGDSEESRYKVISMHVGGLMVRSGGRRSAWDSERQRLTAMQWLVAYAIAKPGKKIKHGNVKGKDLLWCTSSRVMADMWLKSMRNPDIKFAN